MNVYENIAIRDHRKNPMVDYISPVAAGNALVFNMPHEEVIEELVFEDANIDEVDKQLADAVQQAEIVLQGDFDLVLPMQSSTSASPSKFNANPVSKPEISSEDGTWLSNEDCNDADPTMCHTQSLMGGKSGKNFPPVRMQVFISSLFLANLESKLKCVCST